ncbi:MAG: guanylate kinase [Zoogloeaceae bacterium]|jgi:guanylate kinase|nr:guanylate kinase [Zoogloeaceae bacterium]
MPGLLFIVAAPSGAGKTTLVRHLLAEAPEIRLSISFTTRAPRPGEVEGRDYHFIDADTFKAMIAAGDFLEWAEVHGHFYGTSRRWIERERAAGHDVLLEIDWQGAAQVRRLWPEAVGIFILPPSLEILAERLAGRGTDSAETVARRLAAAREEIRHAGEFDYAIINHILETALADFSAIVRASRLTLAAQREQNAALFAHFD